MLSSSLEPTVSDRTHTRVLLVEDHPMVREGMHVLLSEAPEFVVCGEAATIEETLAVAARERPDVVCLDLVLGSTNGFGLIRQLLEIDSRMRILVITAREEEAFARRCLEAGALGFAMKTEMSDTLLIALRRVAAGCVHLSPRMKLSVIEDLQQKAPERGMLRKLSDREMQVFQFFGLGWSTREIAERLGIGTKTVETHRENIKNKLGLPHSTALVRIATLWVRSLI